MACPQGPPRGEWIHANMPHPPSGCPPFGSRPSHPAPAGAHPRALTPHRDDGQIRAGWAITRGRRFYNEDNIYCKFEPLPDGERVACLAVFDGHGGASASAYVRDNLFKNLLGHANFQTHPFKAMEDAYAETDAAYLELDELERNDDGCTATTAAIVGRTLVVGHVGDSRAVLGECGGATPLTDDHKPNRPDERSRIENVGGTVVHAGTWRVGGVLAVSRSFGNRQLKQWIVAHPELRQSALGPSSSCLVVATDGVWDVVTNEEAVEAVGRCDDAEEAAKYLATMAYDRGSYDNISCVVCIFSFKGDEGSDGSGVTAHDTAHARLATLGEEDEEGEDGVNSPGEGA
jgi:protein phosphatase 1L